MSFGSLGGVASPPVAADSDPIPRAPAANSPLLSETRPEAGSRMAAITVVVVSALLFLSLAPFAKFQLPAQPVFVPIQQAVLIINDLITAVLLLAQLRLSQSRAILVLAAGYLFTALMALVHMLTFPGALAPTGLLGGGAQTTAYLFVFWHIGLPIAVMIYAWLRRRGASIEQARHEIGTAVTVVVALVLLFAGLTTLGHDLFPPMLEGNHYSSAFNVGRFGQWIVTAVAIGVMWPRRQQSVLDQWLLVVLVASFFEIALVAIFNAGRYDLGFYAGRGYSLLASCFVLLMLLNEQVRLYTGLLRARETSVSEAALRQTQQALRLAMQGGRMGVWHRDMATDKVWWSEELEEIFGLPPGGFAGHRQAFHDLVHPEDRASLREAIDHAVANGTEYAIEFRFLHASGEWRWMDGRGRAVYTDRGEPRSLLGIGIDVTARRRAEESAREKEARFKLMADRMPNLAWMARPDGWIYWYNRRWYDYTGTTLADMEGWGWQSVHDPATLPQVVELWQRSIDTGEPFEMVFPLRGADGRLRPFLTRVSPVKADDGQVLHWFGTNTDITQQQDAEALLSQANRRKDAFLATLAHELRNPLAPIRSAVQVLAKAPALPPATGRALDILDRQSRQLARLVDDLMDVSRITEGKLRLKTERLSLCEVVRDAVDAVRPAAERAGLQLRMEGSEDAPQVRGDLTRLTQVFVNLLNNAIKFTPAGGEIEVRVQPQGRYAAVVVRDSGIGIASENLASIFDIFSQASQGLERAQGGLGIGLALVRGFTQLHGGQVTVTSAGVGQGSTFTVELPTAEAQTAEASARADGEAHRRVLIIDPEAETALALRALVERPGLEVASAQNAADAATLLETFRPDVLLIDIGVTDMDAFETARRLRASPTESHIRLVATAGRGHDWGRAQAAGFDACLRKPLDAAVFAAMGLAPAAAAPTVHRTGTDA